MILIGLKLYKTCSLVTLSQIEKLITRIYMKIPKHLKIK